MPRKKLKQNNIRKDVSYKKRRTVAKKKTVSRVAKTRNAGHWTEAMYFQRVRSALRQAFRYWKPALLALEKASRPYVGTRRLKKEYQCAGCNTWFDRKSVEVDHITECGSLSCYEDIITFLQRLTPEDPAAYQVLCKPCHRAKTKLYQKNKAA